MSDFQFKCIGIVGRPQSESVVNSVKALLALLDKHQLHAKVEETFAANIPDLIADVGTTDELAQWADLIISVGGDGTLLGAARFFAPHDIPLLGINRGRLGFLTDIMPEQMEEKVIEVLKGDYVTEDRFLLTAQIIRDGEVITKGTALNDIVLHAGQSIRMITFELHIDDQFVYKQSSDGLIISTPTGSTAYALSAGGPIMHPKLDALELVPMHPHTLSSRPLVVAGSSDIKIKVLDENPMPPHISCDAQRHFATQLGDEVHIKKMPKALHLLHPSDHNYYQICRQKLGWAEHNVG